MNNLPHFKSFPKQKHYSVEKSQQGLSFIGLRTAMQVSPLKMCENTSLVRHGNIFDIHSDHLTLKVMVKARVFKLKSSNASQIVGMNENIYFNDD
jgi:hypothetical protein